MSADFPNGWFFLHLASPLQAALSTCGASASPSEVSPGTIGVFFDVTLTNTSDVPIRWFRITTPHSDISPGRVYSDWSRSSSSNVTTFTDNKLFSTGTSTPQFETDVPASLDDFSGSWNVIASDDPGGANAITCSGSQGLSIVSSAQDTTAPTIGSITVSNVGATSAQVSWTTNETSSSRVEYDVNANFNAYPFNHNDATLTTTHSLI